LCSGTFQVILVPSEPAARVIYRHNRIGAAVVCVSGVPKRYYFVCSPCAGRVFEFKRHSCRTFEKITIPYPCGHAFQTVSLNNNRLLLTARTGAHSVETHEMRRGKCTPIDFSFIEVVTCILQRTTDKRYIPNKTKMRKNTWKNHYYINRKTVVSAKVHLFIEHVLNAFWHRVAPVYEVCSADV